MDITPEETAREELAALFRDHLSTIGTAESQLSLERLVKAVQDAKVRLEDIAVHSGVRCVLRLDQQIELPWLESRRETSSCPSFNIKKAKPRFSHTSVSSKASRQRLNQSKRNPAKRDAHLMTEKKVVNHLDQLMIDALDPRSEIPASPRHYAMLPHFHPRNSRALKSPKALPALHSAKEMAPQFDKHINSLTVEPSHSYAKMKDGYSLKASVLEEEEEKVVHHTQVASASTSAVKNTPACRLGQGLYTASKRPSTAHSSRRSISSNQARPKSARSMRK